MECNFSVGNTTGTTTLAQTLTPNPGTRALTLTPSLTVPHLQCLDCLTSKPSSRRRRGLSVSMDWQDIHQPWKPWSPPGPIPSSLHITPVCDDWCVSQPSSATTHKCENSPVNVGLTNICSLMSTQEGGLTIISCREWNVSLLSASGPLSPICINRAGEVLNSSITHASPCYHMAKV